MTTPAQFELPAGMYRATGVALNAQASGDAPVWAHVSPAGVRASADEPAMVRGADGREFAIDDPQSVIANTTLPMLIDIDHVSLAAGQVPGATSESFGWVEELRYVGADETSDVFSEAGFWGRVEWTDLGLDRVERKHFRNVSPVIEMTTRDGVKYAHRFVNVALTNLPNLQMVSLNRRGAPKESAHMDANEILDTLRSQLDLPEDAEADVVLQALADALGVTVTLGEPEEPAPAEEPPAGEGMAEANARIVELEGQLSAHILRDTEAATAAVDLAVKEGRADEARRSTLVRLYRDDRASFEAFTVRKAPAVTPILQPVTGPDTTAATPSKMTAPELASFSEEMTPGESHYFTNLCSGGFTKQAAAQKILDARG